MAADPLWRPPEELEKIKKSQEIASQLLLEKNFIRMLYLWIQDAAVKATRTKSVIDDSRKTCALPIGTLATERTKPCSITERYHITYHPEDILIVGGVAISLYDEAISGIKISKYQNTNTLRDYLQKDTTDIDMVWWPRFNGNTPQMDNHVVTINSPAISTLVSTYISELTTIFTNQKAIELIESELHAIHADITLVRIEVKESVFGISAGTKKVLIQFIITVPEMNQKELILEMCDISIHDGASSQIEVNPINKTFILQPMMVDPVWCDPGIQTTTFPLVHAKKLYVPNIISILEQQLLAFKNLLHFNNEKCLINYKRIRYLQLMIFQYLHQKRNVNIHKIFKIQVDSIDSLFENINSYLEGNILEICSKQNRHNRSNLCQTIQRLYMMYQSQLQDFYDIHVRQQIQLQQSQIQEMSLHNKVASVQNSPCVLPDMIEYAMGKHKFVFYLGKNSHSRRHIETEYPVLCKYYHLLDKSKDKEQFKRVKIIIHDIVENKKMDRIQQRIDAEANYEPLKSELLKSELLAKQGGFIRRKQTRRMQTRRLRRKNKTHTR